MKQNNLIIGTLITMSVICVIYITIWFMKEVFNIGIY